MAKRDITVAADIIYRSLVEPTIGWFHYILNTSSHCSLASFCYTLHIPLWFK